MKFKAEDLTAQGGLNKVLPERLRYLASRIHTLGPRALYELLCELQNGAPLHERLWAYARLAPLAPFIAALGGVHLPTLRPIRESQPKPMKPRATGRRQ